MWVVNVSHSISSPMSLMMMPVLGSSASEWLDLLCSQACWKWLSLALQEVSDWACFVFKPAENGCLVVLGSSVSEWLGLLCSQACWKWLSLALQSVSDWAYFFFKLAENGCPWLSSWWVTGLAFFSSLLKMIVLGSPECEWLGLLCFQAC